jgi:hypothetical protein
MARYCLDDGVVGYATSMPGDAPSIQSGEIARGVEFFAPAPAAALAARHRLPAAYAHTYFANSLHRGCCKTIRSLIRNNGAENLAATL